MEVVKLYKYKEAVEILHAAYACTPKGDPAEQEVRDALVVAVIAALHELYQKNYRTEKAAHLVGDWMRFAQSRADHLGKSHRTITEIMSDVGRGVKAWARGEMQKDVK